MWLLATRQSLLLFALRTSASRLVAGTFVLLSATRSTVALLFAGTPALPLATGTSAPWEGCRSRNKSHFHLKGGRTLSEPEEGPGHDAPWRGGAQG